MFPEPDADLPFDRLLFRVLTGSWRRFFFKPGPAPDAGHGLPDGVGVYVHIPFCRSLCPFCPYNKVLFDDDLAAGYGDCLMVEVERVVSKLGDRRISSVYLGGGTPLIVPETVDSVLMGLAPRLAAHAQVAIEIHPCDVCDNTAAMLKKTKVNMVSLGVQSLDDRILAGLGRDHDSAKALYALGKLVDSGLSANVDLITGIPGQNLDSMISDVKQILGSGADQVSAYPLMDFAFTGMKSRLSWREQGKMLSELAEAASKAGYERTSVWTWTRPGAPRYTSITRDNYIGIGAGAASFVGDRFWLNTFDVHAYIEAVRGGGSPAALHTTMDCVEESLYRLFWKCYDGEFELNSLAELLRPSATRLANLGERLGLAERTGSTVRLTEKGFFYYHMLERYYTRRYIGRLWAECRRHPFPKGVLL